MYMSPKKMPELFESGGFKWNGCLVHSLPLGKLKSISGSAPFTTFFLKQKSRSHLWKTSPWGRVEKWKVLQTRAPKWHCNLNFIYLYRKDSFHSVWQPGEGSALGMSTIHRGAFKLRPLGQSSTFDSWILVGFLTLLVHSFITWMSD